MLVYVMDKQVACKPGSASPLAGVIEKGWMGARKEPWPGLALRMDHGYGTACVLASIDE